MASRVYSGKSRYGLERESGSRWTRPGQSNVETTHRLTLGAFLL